MVSCWLACVPLPDTKSPGTVPKLGDSCNDAGCDGIAVTTCCRNIGRCSLAPYFTTSAYDALKAKVLDDPNVR